MEFLIAKMVIDEGAHQRFALLLGHGVRVVIGLHIEQSLTD
jgi:hypothetical protein